jgi:CheY-like chemotaxis protein
MNNNLALVLTPDAQTIRVMEQTLPQFGLRVMVIRDGREALQQLDAFKPALVMLDLRLSNGFDILTHTNATFTRIVILTSDVVCVHLTGRAADAELLQPISAQDVADVLRQMPEFAELRQL